MGSALTFHLLHRTCTQEDSIKHRQPNDEMEKTYNELRENCRQYIKKFDRNFENNDSTEEQNEKDRRQGTHLSLLFWRLRVDNVRREYFNKNRDYVDTFNALMDVTIPETARSHGPPRPLVPIDATCQSSSEIPPQLLQWWTEPRESTRPLSEIETKMLSMRAENFASLFHSARHARFFIITGLWKNSYQGFKDVQRELSGLREDLFRRRLDISVEDKIWHSADELHKIMTGMYNECVRHWFYIWGELDLHGVTIQDAITLIGEALNSKDKDEIRIVSGQRPHGGSDHVSRGSLFSLLNTVFRSQHAEWTLEETEDYLNLKRRVDRIIETERITCRFFTEYAAVSIVRRASVWPSLEEASGSFRGWRPSRPDRNRSGPRRPQASSSATAVPQENVTEVPGPRRSPSRVRRMFVGANPMRFFGNSRRNPFSRP